jgi:hypothetical protein
MKTSKHPKLANGQPVISCFALSKVELVRREDAAHLRAEQLAVQEETSPWEIGRFQLWHTECPVGLKLVVCDEELFRLTAFLPTDLLEMNGGQPLDFWDYAYVADVLREWLVALDTPAGDMRNMRRALAWVEERGSGLRDFTQEA